MAKVVTKTGAGIQQDVGRRLSRMAVDAARVVALLALGTVSVATEAPFVAPMIPNVRMPMDGVVTGGQPTLIELDQAARAGCRTVIDLRTPSETRSGWERVAAERLGMLYIQIPIAGAADLTFDNAEILDYALREARLEGPVLLHCGSGNRAGALLALREHWLCGATPEAALALGQAAGLTSLEPEIRKILGLEPRKDVQTPVLE